jgi:hypothetical protein
MPRHGNPAPAPAAPARDTSERRRRESRKRRAPREPIGGGLSRRDGAMLVVARWGYLNGLAPRTAFHHHPASAINAGTCPALHACPSGPLMAARRRPLGLGEVGTGRAGLAVLFGFV